MPNKQRRRPASGPPAAPVASAPAARAIPNDKPKLDSLIAALEAVRGSRVIVYWTTDMAKMSEAAVMPLYDHLESIGHVPKLDLLLYTRGGDTEVPWRIVSLIREFCDHFCVLVPHRAASAGTLTALGADEIVMTPIGVLGPIDPTRAHPLLPKVEGAAAPEPVSVQDMRHAMNFIREAAGPGNSTSYTPEAMAQIFTALFEKIHPLAIGAIEQSYALSKLIGKQCLSTHMDPVADAAQIDAIVSKLCDDFKSHSYLISRREARAIGLKAVDADGPTEAAMFGVLKFYLARPVAAGPPTAGQNWSPILAWMDSTAVKMRCEGNAVVDKDGTITHRGDRWVAY